jgi:hypothetical protein
MAEGKNKALWLDRAKLGYGVQSFEISYLGISIVMPDDFLNGAV